MKLKSMTLLSIVCGCVSSTPGPSVVEFQDVTLAQAHTDWQETIYTAKASAEEKTGLRHRGTGVVVLQPSHHTAWSNAYHQQIGVSIEGFAGFTSGNKQRQVLALIYGPNAILFGPAEHEWAEAIALAHGLPSAHTSFKGKGIYGIP